MAVLSSGVCVEQLGSGCCGSIALSASSGRSLTYKGRYLCSGILSMFSG